MIGPEFPILVVGCGSIGERHIRNLRTLGARKIWIVDPSEERRHRVAKDYGAIEYPTLKAALSNCPGSVLICTPPISHLSVAQQAVSANAHVFLEKPISPTLDGVDEFLQHASRLGRIVQIGYNLRFQAGMRRLKSMLEDGVIGKHYLIQAEFGQYLPDWRPTQDYRKGYSVSPENGGGIILEASHEIDYVRWLCGEVHKVSCTARRLGALEMETEDTAWIALSMADGILGEIHLDCLQRVYSRHCKVVGEFGILTWELKGGVKCFRPDTGWKDFPVDGEVNDMYVTEMQDFLNCVADASGLASVTGEDGRRVLEIVLAAKESARLGKEIEL